MDASIAKATGITPAYGFGIMAALWVALNIGAAWLGLRFQAEVAAGLAWFEALAGR